MQKLSHVVMAMAQLLNIRMPESYEVTVLPPNADLPGVDGPGKDPSQSGLSNSYVISCFTLMFAVIPMFYYFIVFKTVFKKPVFALP